MKLTLMILTPFLLTLVGCGGGGGAGGSDNTTTFNTCTFGETTIANGNSVSAYQSTSVPFGSSCSQETRTCSNGTLSGSFQFSSCSVEPEANSLNENIFLSRQILEDSPEHYETVLSQCPQLNPYAINHSKQHLIPVNLNDDGIMDFFTVECCSAGLGPGVVTDAEAPAVLVSYTSNSDGSYYVSNEEVFGSKVFKVGAWIRKWASGDINGDGRVDFAFATNQEDGRDQSVHITNTARPRVLMSSPTTYEIVELGERAWNHAVQIIENKKGNTEVIFGSYSSIATQAFEYIAGEFINISEKYPVDFQVNGEGFQLQTATHFIPITNRNTGAVEAFASVIQKLGDVNGFWTGTDLGIVTTTLPESNPHQIIDYTLKPIKYIEYIDFNNLTKGVVSYVSVNGKDLIGGHYNQMCLLGPIVTNGPRYVVGHTGGATLKSGEKLQPVGSGVVYNESNEDGIWEETGSFSFYEINEDNYKLTPVSSPIFNEDYSANVWKFDCTDINNDGLEDLIAYSFEGPDISDPSYSGPVKEGGNGGHPIIYLSNGKGELINVDSSFLPVYPRDDWGRAITNSIDVNNDGIVDFLQRLDDSPSDVVIHMMKNPVSINNDNYNE